MTDAVDEDEPVPDAVIAAQEAEFLASQAASARRHLTPVPAPPAGGPPPHDLEAEEAVIAAMIISGDACAKVRTAGLSARHFYAPANQAIYHAACQLLDAGLGVDLVSLHATLTPDQLADAASYNAPSTTNAGTYARRIIHTHQLREVISRSHEAATQARAGDLPAALEAVSRLVHTQAAAELIRHQPLGAFIDSDDPDYDWIIAGLLERTDRVLVTGPEGGGKSTLLRQIAVMSAAGIHPFTHNDIDPLRVLLLDLENSEKHVRRQLRPMRISANQQADERLEVAGYPQGLDLTDPTDVGMLTRLITEVQPDLVVGGPIYKLVGGDPTEEQPAKAAAMTLDRLRTEHGFALILETHQPHDNGGKRPERPYGASLWKRWPEFGIHLAETGQIRHWRGARDEREWPTMLQRGGVWPWTLEVNSKLLTYARIAELTREHGRRLSERELSNLTGAPKTNIHNAIEANKTEYDALCDQVEM